MGLARATSGAAKKHMLCSCTLSFVAPGGLCAQFQGVPGSHVGSYGSCIHAGIQIPMVPMVPLGSPWFPLVPMVPIPMVPVMEKPFEFFHLLLIPHVLCSGATPLWNVGPFDRIPQPPQRAMLEATGFRLLTYWQRTLVWLKPWCSTEQFEGCLHSSACYDQLNLWKTHSGCFPILRPWS